MAEYRITTLLREVQGLRVRRDGDKIHVGSWEDGEMGVDLPALNAGQARDLAAALNGLADIIEPDGRYESPPTTTGGGEDGREAAD